MLLKYKSLIYLHCELLISIQKLKNSPKIQPSNSPKFLESARGTLFDCIFLDHSDEILIQEKKNLAIKITILAYFVIKDFGNAIIDLNLTSEIFDFICTWQFQLERSIIDLNNLKKELNRITSTMEFKVYCSREEIIIKAIKKINIDIKEIFKNIIPSQSIIDNAMLMLDLDKEFI